MENLSPNQFIGYYCYTLFVVTLFSILINTFITELRQITNANIDVSKEPLCMGCLLVKY